MATRKNNNGKPDQDICELRSGKAVGTQIIRGVTFNQKALIYAEVDGNAVFEGDIVLGSLDQMNADAGEVLNSVYISDTNKRWPNATIPYEIDPALPNQARVTDAIAHWEANTRIRFVLRTAANAASYPDYVRFVPGGGCSSFVGRIGGRQDLTLGSGCSTGNAIHELGHAVGLWHEQSREDRDSFVRIRWENITAGMEHNFSQHIADGDDSGAYDYGSIMHYPLTAFSSNGLQTIEVLGAVPAGVTIGQRSGLSAGDIAGVNAMYPPISTFKEVPKDPVSDTFKETRKDLRKDPVTDTIKEVRKDFRKDPISDTFKELRKDPIRDPIGTLRENIGSLAENIGTLPGGQIPINPAGWGGATPFIAGSPSQFQDQFGGNAMMDNDAQVLLAQLDEITQAINQTQEQLDMLYQAHDEIQQLLNGG